MRFNTNLKNLAKNAHHENIVHDITYTYRPLQYILRPVLETFSDTVNIWQVSYMYTVISFAIIDLYL
jgi:hypothetical protein